MKNLIHDPLINKNSLDFTKRGQARDFLALGDFMGWRTHIIGQAPMLTEPVRLQDWLLVPAQLDTTPIPARTLRRIHTIYSQGLHPQGFVMVHEAPMQLTDPSPNAREKGPVQWEAVGQVVGGVARVLGMLMLGGMLLPVGLLAGLIMLDPILIAVTQDNYWIEIDRWQV